MSCVLQRLMGMSTNSSFPCSKGLSSLRVFFLGTRCWLGVYIFLVSQLLLCRIAVARLQLDSNIAPHSDGGGFPPKLKQSIMRRRPILTSCMQVWTAVAVWTLHCWKADLKSNFEVSILTLGNLRQAVTVQLTIHLMHAPNMQERSLLACVWLLTEVPTFPVMESSNIYNNAIFYGYLHGN